jgi:hypothetical protein
MGKGEDCAVSRLLRSPLPYAFIVLVGGYYWQTRDIRHGPGPVAPDRPGQERIDAAPFEHRGARLLPRARFQIEARVLGTEHYWLDDLADVSPIDLALGWGPMSDEAVLDRLDISQGERFVFALPRERLPISRTLFQLTFSNFHMIPADSKIEHGLERLRRGEVVRLQGMLVDVELPGGSRWKSSTVRNDFGAGACEILYATLLEIR